MHFDISRPELVGRFGFYSLPQLPTVSSMRSQTVVSASPSSGHSHPAFFRSSAGYSSCTAWNFGTAFSTRRLCVDLRAPLGVDSVCDDRDWTVCNEGDDCRNVWVAQNKR